MELVTESQQAPRQFKYLALIYVIYAVTLLSSGLLANRMTSVGIFIQAGGTLTFPLTYPSPSSFFGLEVFCLALSGKLF